MKVHQTSIRAEQTLWIEMHANKEDSTFNSLNLKNKNIKWSLAMLAVQEQQRYWSSAEQQEKPRNG